MKVEGSYTFDAPRDRVWTVLLDPEALKACVPGLESLTPTGENAYEANLKVGVAAIRGSYKGHIQLTDLVEPSNYKMLVEGKGAPASFAASPRSNWWIRAKRRPWSSRVMGTSGARWPASGSACWAAWRRC